MRTLILLGGSVVFCASLTLRFLQAPLGSAAFFALAAAMGGVYVVLLRWLLTATPAAGSASRLLVAALLFAVAFRVPLATTPISPQNDMIRYLYDGRLQRLGYNPLTAVPADPALAATHTPTTRLMPSSSRRSPYPAGAQLFFRLVVTVRESPLAMKIALLICDLLTIGALWAWLGATGRSPWLVLAYAWNPLVILEVAYSGHIDVLGAMWVVVSAWMLTTRRGALAAATFALAVASKLLPVVLIPLYWRRIRLRDAALGLAVLVASYLPFVSAGTQALGAVPAVVRKMWFNGPVFQGVATVAGADLSAAAAVCAGFVIAAWLRHRLSVSDPAAWVWPMATALAAAPVVYPWYLLFCAPFLFAVEAIPVAVWTLSILPVYVVWQLSPLGYRWAVPPGVLLLEYGPVIVAAALMGRWLRRTAHGLTTE